MSTIIKARDLPALERRGLQRLATGNICTTIEGT